MKTIKSLQKYGWPALELSNNELVLVCTPSIGGRIISLQYYGQELLFLQAEHQGETFDFSTCSDLKAAKKAMGFRLWGGDKTWVAPQADWLVGIPPLELDAGIYTATHTSSMVQMVSPVCRETGLQITRTVHLSNQGVRLTEQIRNCSTVSVSKGIWNVTQIKRPCSFYIPASKGGIRSYHHEDNTLPPVSEEFLGTPDGYEIPCTHAQLFKYGVMPVTPKIITAISHPEGQIHWTRTFDYDPLKTYPHHSAVEVFNSSDYPYAELEVHSPLSLMAPQSTTTLCQQWRFSLIPSKK